MATFPYKIKGDKLRLKRQVPNNTDFDCRGRLSFIFLKILTTTCSPDSIHSLDQRWHFVGSFVGPTLKMTLESERTDCLNLGNALKLGGVSRIVLRIASP